MARTSASRFCMSPYSAGKGKFCAAHVFRNYRYARRGLLLQLQHNLTMGRHTSNITRAVGMPFAFRESNILTAWLGGTTSSSVPCCKSNQIKIKHFDRMDASQRVACAAQPMHYSTGKPLQGRMGESITAKHACRAAVLRQASSSSCLIDVAAWQQTGRSTYNVLSLEKLFFLLLYRAAEVIALSESLQSTWKKATGVWKRSSALIGERSS